MEFPKSLQSLIAELKKLPGVGEKSARRYAFHLLDAGAKGMKETQEAIRAVATRVRRCERCGGLSEAPLCNTCSDEKRDRKVICVVENFKDVYRIEETGQFDGVYHVLGGLVSPLDRASVALVAALSSADRRLVSSASCRIWSFSMPARLTGSGVPPSSRSEMTWLMLLIRWTSFSFMSS